LGIAAEGNVEVLFTKREVDPTVWNMLESVQKSLLGAFYCLRRDKVAPMDNVPTDIKVGWNFALWYCYQAGSKSDHGAYLSIPRETTLLRTKGVNAWSSGVMITVLQRINAFVRIAANNCSGKLDQPKKFLKGEGYFLEKYVGKKPIGGLYTDEELPIVVQAWTDRQNRIKDLYKQIPDKFSEVLGKYRGIGDLVGAFNISMPQVVKDIEDAKNRRIPYLLVSTGKGRGKTVEIAKGGNLPEKLLHTSGGDGVRTIGRVLWSPITGYTTNAFIDLVINQCRSMIRKEKVSFLDHLITTTVTNGDKDTHGRLLQCSASVNQAAQLYLEILPDHAGEQSWGSVFGTG